MFCRESDRVDDRVFACPGFLVNHERLRGNYVPVKVLLRPVQQSCTHLLPECLAVMRAALSKALSQSGFLSRLELI